MKKSLSALALIMSVMTAPAVFATERTVTFAIDNMTCASCPYIVKTSMAAVPGVSTVAVSFEAKTATVTFDEIMDALKELDEQSRQGFTQTPAYRRWVRHSDLLS